MGDNRETLIEQGPYYELLYPQQNLARNTTLPAISRILSEITIDDHFLPIHSDKINYRLRAAMLP
jgi:hypothetical protein